MSVDKSNQEIFTSGKIYYLIGPYPPPIGGISVYIYRYGRLLESQGYNVKYVDYGKLNKVEKLILLLSIIIQPSFSIFHLNGVDYATMSSLSLRIFKCKVIFQDHSGRFIEEISLFGRLVISLFFRRVDECLFVGDHLVDYYLKKGIKLPKNLNIKNAFLPPPPEDEINIWKSYSTDTIDFINNHKPLIIANAFQIVIYKGIDLYGIDMCIDLIAQLKDEFPSVGLLFGLAEIGNNEYYAKMNHCIVAKGIQNNFFFMVGQRELWPIFKKADLSLRPTYNDGFGISVAESLYFGCPAVASDVCKRPMGTKLFKNRDLQDLTLKVHELLNKENIKSSL